MSVIKEGDVFKDTVVSDVVVERHVQLQKGGKFVTFHDFKNEPNNVKSWFLDARCELTPTRERDIQKTTRIVRPRGTWSLTARLAGEQMEMYLFTLSWPRSWASKGYSSFTFGLRTQDEAKAWHRAIAESIALLGKQQQGGDSSSEAAAAGVGNAYAESNVSTASMPLCPPGTARDDEDDDVVAPSPPPRAGPGSKSFASHSMPSSSAAAASAASAALASSAAVVTATAAAGSAREPSGSAASTLPPPLQTATAANGGKQWRALTARWVPYKQTNGVAIYHLEESGAKIPGLGGEFMVSTVIRGPPNEVLASLMYGSSHTTILGPASEVEVLEGAKEEPPPAPGRRNKLDGRVEVVRLVLEAPGIAGRVCAPREMVVQRILKTEEGMHVVLFSSVEHSAAGQGTAPRKVRSLFPKPVVGSVRGTYIIAPLNGHRLDTSPETMITCILKVDLKGSCGDSSWFRSLSYMLGLTDAFLDRMLMTVILVRDEVEHSRFVLEWQKVLHETDELAEEAVDAGVSGTSPTSGARALGRMQSSFQRSGSGRRDRELRPLSSVRAAEDSPATASQSSAARSASRSASRVAGRPTSMVAEEAEAEADAAASQAGEQAMDLEHEDEPEGVLVDLDSIRAKATMDPKFWEKIHAPDAKAAPFSVRGPTYLKDRKKIPAGDAVFTLASMDLVTLPSAVEHVARFLPSIRSSGAPFAIVINLIIPGTPLLGLVATFITDKHPDQALGPKAPANPMSDEHNWEPFDFVLHRFVNGSNAVRNQMLKLIPHIANGSWVIRQSVGTTPVIIGKALKTTFHVTPQYIEVDIDVSANSTAAYVTGMVRGATTGLIIDMGFVLEGTSPWELPECLLGGLRLNFLDTKTAKPLDMSKELPLLPPVSLRTLGGGGAPLGGV